MTWFAARTALQIVYLATLFGVFVFSTNGTLAALPNVSMSGECTHDIECDDGLPCTLDRCDFPSNGPVGAGNCQHLFVPDGQSGGIGGPDCAQNFGLLCGGCDDGAFCNGAETCHGGACVAGVPPCAGGQVCSESLNICQPGPCNAQKTCIGGPTPGTACTTTFGCGNGGRCGFADCDDGVLCNGDESCVAGVCRAGENPCGHGATCGERQCSLGPSIDICLTDQDCANGLGTCSLLGPVCARGRCCVGSNEPTCSPRLKRGICAGSTPNTNAGAACWVNSDCDSNSCPASGGSGVNQSCDGQGGQFYPSDSGSLPNSGGVCPFTNVVQIRCPKYGSGVAPHGNEIQFVGPVSNSTIANLQSGTRINKLGDDYRFSNPGICAGGTRNGLGCANNSGCPGGGVCNLSGPSVMSVYYIRMLGDFFPDTQVVVEFRDAAGRFVAESYAERVTVAGLERLYFDPPLIVPSEGFVVLRVASEYTPNGGFVWTSTDAVDVGSNDPGVLWVNDGPVANFLAPSPGILAFEMEGEKVAAPLGACCDATGTGCTDGVLPWVCQGDGNVFQGLGTTCPAPACDTGACCAPNSGACITGTEFDCSNAGGEFQGYGTDCDPDCCPKSFHTGADRCESVTIFALGVPSVVTITGDNSPASLLPGEPMCYVGSDTPPIELGWYEAFSIVECAMIRVDYCCTDPVKRPAYPVLFDECPCAAPILSNPNPYLFPQTAHERGAPYCDDENQWATFGPLHPGVYYIPVQSGVPGTFGQYQVHITAEACPTAACCVADQCTGGVNQLECDTLGGTFLAPPQKVPAVNDCSSAPCATGSCCTGPGECTDRAIGQPMTPADCENIQGTYHGGVRCKGGSCQTSPGVSCSVNADCPGNDTCTGGYQAFAQPLPCPLCSIESATNCQPFDNTLNFTLSDRHLGFDGMLAADDFRPHGTILDRVCVWGFYLDGDPNRDTNDCGSAVNADHFRVRVFANDPSTGRSPGILVGASTATSRRGIVPQSLLNARLAAEVYGFELVLDNPILNLTNGEVYWLEVSNDVSNSLSTCNWFWNQRATTQYSYSLTGNESGYPAPNATPYDNAFCLNFGFSPSTIGTMQGACCTCDGVCSLKTLYNCDNSNGVWDFTRTTCSGVTCPAGPPPNDNCVDGPPTITAGTYTVSNQCATTDGFGPASSDLGGFGTQIDFDLWYYFIAPTACDLVVSECQAGLRFDSALAVYYNPNNPAQCPPCPFNASASAAHLAGVTQDESCLGVAIGGAGLWRASEQILRPAYAGECFLIRVGSFPGSRGTGIMDVSCDLIAPTALPDPTGLPKSRFISFQIPAEATGQSALRVKLASLHHVVPPYSGGPSVPFSAFEGYVRWVGPPLQHVESTASGTPFHSSELQCTPHYRDWSTVGLLHVTGPAVVPSSTYEVSIIPAGCMGNEHACAAAVLPLSISTSRWGDVDGPYNPPSTTIQPDLADISSLVNKFKNAPGAPIKARALLAGLDPFGNMNIALDFDFSHIAACVDAFRGRPYPYTITICP